MDENAQRHMIAKLNRKRQREYFKAYQRSQGRKRAEKKQRIRKQPKSHAVAIELTKRRSKELLYIAFKPTKKDLFLKRYSLNRIYFFTEINTKNFSWFLYVMFFGTMTLVGMSVYTQKGIT